MSTNGVTNTTTTSSVTKQGILDAIDRVGFARPFAAPQDLFGMKVHLVEPHIVPKLKLSANVPLPDDFRREFDAWLLEQFGTIDLTAQRRGQVFISDVFGLMVVRRDDYAAFIHHC